VIVRILIAALLLAGLRDLPVLTSDEPLTAMAPLHEDVLRVDFADDDANDELAMVDLDDDLLPAPRVQLLEWRAPSERVVMHDEATPPSPPRDSVFRPPRLRS
jgi:hypothetical protein